MADRWRQAVRVGLLRGVVVLLRCYQVTLSPDHGLWRGLFPRGVCRYQPTCSTYAVGAVEHFGWRGVWMSLQRVGRCHPWGGHGYDPVPRCKSTNAHANAANISWLTPRSGGIV